MYHELLLALMGYPGEIFQLKKRMINTRNEVQINIIDEDEDDIGLQEEDSEAEEEEYFSINKSLPIIKPEEIELLNRILKLGDNYRIVKSYIEIKENEHSLYIKSFKLSLNEIMEKYEKKVLLIEEGILLGRDLDSGSTPISYLLSIFHTELFLFLFLKRMIKGIIKEKLNANQVYKMLYESRIHGNETIETEIKNILVQMNLVFLNYLTYFLLNGSIYDPYSEFFIMLDNNNNNINNTATIYNIYEDDSITNINLNFIILDDKIPPFLSKEHCITILFIGKIITIVQQFNYNLIEYRQLIETELNYQNISHDIHYLIENSIDKIEKEINKTILNKLIQEKIQFLQHIKILRDIYLLGNGELFFNFNQLLMNNYLNENRNIQIEEFNFLFVNLINQNCYQSEFKFLNKFKFINNNNEYTIINNNNNNNNNNNQYQFLNMIGIYNKLELKYNNDWLLKLILNEMDFKLYNELYLNLFCIKFILQKLQSIYKKVIKLNIHYQYHWFFHFLNNYWSYLQFDVIQKEFDILIIEIINENKDNEKEQEYVEIKQIIKKHWNFLLKLKYSSFLFNINIKNIIFNLLNLILKFVHLIYNFNSNENNNHDENEDTNIISMDNDSNNLDYLSSKTNILFKDFMTQLKFLYRTLNNLNQFNGEDHKGIMKYMQQNLILFINRLNYNNCLSTLM
ncbi:hypothetical protein K502DRAFT_363154 [Neoconidiobolus thromboides FSU 785]|nr:hypothetical protein K502DRAFT_363154 [Neoconidiobolus thromboides FSU 785]